MKVVLKLDVHDEKCKQRAMKMASTVTGLDSISVDLKEKKLTVTGEIDPVAIVSKLRKVYHVEIVSVGPVKGPEKKDEANKKKDEPNKKKDEPMNDPKKKGGFKDQAQVGEPVTGYYVPPYYIPVHHYHEEYPNSCVIC